jgi:hypothetical protein
MVTTTPEATMDEYEVNGGMVIIWPKSMKLLQYYLFNKVLPREGNS